VYIPYKNIAKVKFMLVASENVFRSSLAITVELLVSIFDNHLLALHCSNWVESCLFLILFDAKKCEKNSLSDIRNYI